MAITVQRYDEIDSSLQHMYEELFALVVELDASDAKDRRTYEMGRIAAARVEQLRDKLRVDRAAL